MPLAVVIIAFAVANRQIVTVSLDPFNRTRPPLAVTLPLFALVIVLLIAGVVIGGVGGMAAAEQVAAHGAPAGARGGRAARRERDLRAAATQVSRTTAGRAIRRALQIRAAGRA